MERQILWEPWAGPGLEHLCLRQRATGVVADGMVIGVADQHPFRLHYQVHCDLTYQVRWVSVALLEPAQRLVRLERDQHGHWTDATGAAQPALAGCADVDIAATPFTNTLPIRRLGLQPDEAAELAVAYIDVPSLQVTADGQRYTCVRHGADEAIYRYESLTSDFTADLRVDTEGLVVEYAGLFRRRWPSADSSLEHRHNEH